MRRPRFRFGVRTLLVVVTLVALFFGYHVLWITARRDFLRREGVRTSKYSLFLPYHVRMVGADMDTDAPGLLWLFGDDGVTSMIVPRSDAGRARSLFPETRIAPAQLNISNIPNH